MERTLRTGIALALTAASLLTVALHLPRGASMQIHSHDHRHPLPAAGHAPSDTAESDAAIEKLLAGSRQDTQSTQNLGTVFDLSKLSDGQKRWARAILGQGCDYDWQRLVAPLAGRRIKIALGSPAARAVFYPSELRLVIHRYYYRSQKTEASRLLGWETAHAVDILAVTDDERSDITDLYHPSDSDDHGWLAGDYEHQVGEAFMEGFVAAFCPALSTEPIFDHPTTDQIADGIRAELS